MLNNTKSQFEVKSHELVGAEVCFIIIFSLWATWTHVQKKQKVGYPGLGFCQKGATKGKEKGNYDISEGFLM